MTAELALGLPVLLSMTVGLVWLLAAGAAQVQVIDAAREAARAVARGDDQDAAVSVAERIAPEARVTVSLHGDQVTVSASADVRGPGGLFEHLPAVRVGSEAVAMMEQP